MQTYCKTHLFSLTESQGGSKGIYCRFLSSSYFLLLPLTRFKNIKKPILTLIPVINFLR